MGVEHYTVETSHRHADIPSDGPMVQRSNVLALLVLELLPG